jgi:hypothetical protein
MTELMKQLQQWANEGLYIFPCEEYQNGAVKTQNGILHTYMIHEHLQLVLDGTIQVLRPVEHYAPPKRETIRVIKKADGFRLQYQGVIGDDGEFYGALWDNKPSSVKLITHWQPLPEIEGVV